jgi:hypothetical protein
MKTGDTTDSMIALLTVYNRLHDGLADMVEKGRLTEDQLPDDYRWLRFTLEQADVAAATLAQALRASREQRKPNATGLNGMDTATKQRVEQETP